MDCDTETSPHSLFRAHQCIDARRCSFVLQPVKTFLSPTIPNLRVCDSICSLATPVGARVHADMIYMHTCMHTHSHKGMYTCPHIRAHAFALSRIPFKTIAQFWTSGQWMTERAGGSDVSRGEDGVVSVGSLMAEVMRKRHLMY